MKTGNLFYLSVILAWITLGFTACSDDDDDGVVPIQIVSAITFTDTDLTEGKIGGPVTWTGPADLQTVTRYIVYNSADGTTKTKLLGETSVATAKYTISAGTEYLGYLIIVCANATGESYNSVSIAVTDEVEPEVPVIDPDVLGVFFLNNTTEGATLDFFNTENNVLMTDVYQTVNGRKLEGTANDMVVYGTKAYMALADANAIEIVDLSGASLKTIKPLDEKGKPQSPRRFTVYDGDVYVTLYDGHLACIDTLNLEIVAKAVTGPNPEGVTVANGKLYVANSGAESLPESAGNSITIINAATFVNESKTLETILNPNRIVADSEGTLFVISNGNGADVKPTLQRIDPKSGEISIIETNDVLYAALCNDKLYYFSAESNAPASGRSQNVKCLIYDTKTEAVISENFITDGTLLENVLSINVDPVDETIYISTSGLSDMGSMYVFSPEGKKKNQYEVSGTTPIGAYFLTVGIY